MSLRFRCTVGAWLIGSALASFAACSPFTGSDEHPSADAATPDGGMEPAVTAPPDASDGGCVDIVGFEQLGGSTLKTGASTLNVTDPTLEATVNLGAGAHDVAQLSRTLYLTPRTVELSLDVELAAAPSGAGLEIQPLGGVTFQGDTSAGVYFLIAGDQPTKLYVVRNLSDGGAQDIVGATSPLPLTGHVSLSFDLFPDSGKGMVTIDGGTAFDLDIGRASVKAVEVRLAIDWAKAYTGAAKYSTKLKNLRLHACP